MLALIDCRRSQREAKDLEERFGARVKVVVIRSTVRISVFLSCSRIVETDIAEIRP